MFACCFSQSRYIPTGYIDGTPNSWQFGTLRDKSERCMSEIHSLKRPAVMRSIGHSRAFYSSCLRALTAQAA